jgi:glycosyltransferase involved in cell wall biosynthesis
LDGRDYDTDRALRRELRQSYLVQDICCVNKVEQQQLVKAGMPRVHVLGHAVDANPTPNDFAGRRDILALGSLYGTETPNFDGLRWFIAEIWPRVREALGEVRLLIAGFQSEGLDAERLLAGPGVVHLGFVADTEALYDTARVFLAPTRFAAGIPFKVHEAASYGVPVMATTLLARQLDWQPGQDLMACPAAEPEAFAADLVRLYSDASLWQDVRESALGRIRSECSRAEFTRVIKGILNLPD